MQNTIYSTKIKDTLTLTSYLICHHTAFHLSIFSCQVYLFLLVISTFLLSLDTCQLTLVICNLQLAKYHLYFISLGIPLKLINAPILERNCGYFVSPSITALKSNLEWMRWRALNKKVRSLISIIIDNKLWLSFTNLKPDCLIFRLVLLYSECCKWEEQSTYNYRVSFGNWPKVLVNCLG